MSKWISFDTYSIEDLDLEWREKNYKKVIQFLTKKYQNLIQSIGEPDFQSIDILELHRTHSNFFREASDIDDKRLSNYSNTVNILDDELKLYLLKNNYSSKEDFIKKKFSKEFVLFEKILEMIEFCHDYEKEAKKSLGYLMRIISTAASINPEFGHYVYKDIVQNYLSKLSYFEKKKIEEKRQSNEAGLGFFGPKDILDVIDTYTNILEYQELEIDDETAESIYTASAEEIISWGGNDTKWIGAQLAKLCTGLLSRGMYTFMYKMITEYSEYPIYHKHVYILEIMRHVSDNNILWDCIARMENYIKQNKEAKSFNLSVEPGRELVKKTILDVLELIQNDILLDKMLTKYKEESILDEEVIKKELYNFKEYLLEKKDRIEIADSVEILDIIYKLTGEFKDLFYKFAGGGKFLDALHHELHNIRRYKGDYLSHMKDLEIFQYDKLEKEVLTFKNKVIITSVKNLREVYLEKMSNATSDSEYEFLRDKLINEISEIINKDLNKVIYEDIYNDKKVELISLFNGEKNWMKLDKTTQDFLVSGEIVYNHLLPLGDKVDYSAAVIPLTKALENEIYIYFHREFVNYCNAKGAAIPPSIQEVTNTYFSLNSLNKYAYDRNYTVIANDYLPTMFKGGYVKLSTNSNEKQFIKDVNNIRINYRNKVAHKEGISKQTAVNCRENMLLIKKMLFKFVNDKK